MCSPVMGLVPIPRQRFRIERSTTMVYAKKTLVTDPRFTGRIQTIASLPDNGDLEKALSGDFSEATIVSQTRIPDILVLCNGCNRNISEMDNDIIPYGYLIYLGKRELKADRPYDIYCPSCTKQYFPKAEVI